MFVKIKEWVDKRNENGDWILVEADAVINTDCVEYIRESSEPGFCVICLPSGRALRVTGTLAEIEKKVSNGWKE